MIVSPRIRLIRTTSMCEAVRAEAQLSSACISLFLLWQCGQAECWWQHIEVRDRVVCCTVAHCVSWKDNDISISEAGKVGATVLTRCKLCFETSHSGHQVFNAEVRHVEHERKKVHQLRNKPCLIWGAESRRLSAWVTQTASRSVNDSDHQYFMFFFFSFLREYSLLRLVAQISCFKYLFSLSVTSKLLVCVCAVCALLKKQRHRCPDATRPERPSPGAGACRMYLCVCADACCCCCCLHTHANPGLIHRHQRGPGKTHTLMNGRRRVSGCIGQEKIYTYTLKLCARACVCVHSAEPNSGAGLTRADSMLAYVRFYFCQRLATQPLLSFSSSSSCSSFSTSSPLVLLLYPSLPSGGPFHKSQHLICPPVALLPPRVTPRKFALLRTLCHTSSGRRSGRGGGQVGRGIGWGGEGGWGLCHWPSYSSTVGSCDITSVASLPDLSVTISPTLNQFLPRTFMRADAKSALCNVWQGRAGVGWDGVGGGLGEGGDDAQKAEWTAVNVWRGGGGAWGSVGVLCFAGFGTFSVLD